jgi:putative GTP pyrophosphokinase
VSALQQARAKWIAEREGFDQFAHLLERRLVNLMRGQRLYAEVSSRTKEVHSLVKKLIAKPQYEYDNLPDKVGIRIVVRYRAQTSHALEAVCQSFSHGEIDDKSTKLGTNSVGYQSIHVDHLCFREDTEEAQKFPPTKFFAELQIRSQAQHLWSEVTHDSVYKNDDLIAKLPEDLQRRVHLMAGQIEVADREFDRMNSEIPSEPEIRILRDLEPLYYSLTAEKPDVQLSLDVIRLLLQFYRDQSEDEIMHKSIEPVFTKYEQVLRNVYADDADRNEVSAFLFQPEALLILACLDTDRDRTLKIWNAAYPPEELDKIATTFAISLD